MRTLAIVALALTAAPVAAQPRVGLGGVVGGSAGWASSSIPVIAGSDECGSFESGRSVSAQAGVSLMLERLLGDLGLEAALAIETGTTTLETPPPVPTRIPDERSGGLVELDRFYRREVVERRASLEVLARVGLGDRLRVALGPTLAVGLGGSTEQTDNMTGPGRFRFADGQTARVMASAHSSERAPLAAGLALELGYGVPLGVLELEPVVRAHVDLTSRTSEGALRTIRLGAGVRVHVDITPADPPIIAPAPPRATLAIHGLGIGGRQASPVITMHEVVAQQHIPLVPAVFFEPGAATLSPRYVEVMAAEREEIVAIQHRLLDTVAARLKARPHVRLELWGSTSSDEPAALAGRRVEIVRRHLIERLGVDASRVAARAGGGPLERSSESSADGREDNRRVELAASDPAILAPVIVRHATRTFDPPSIELVPTIEAPAGVLAWSITLEHGDHEVARFTSRDTMPGHPRWAIVGSPSDSGGGELVARLEVIDSVGRSTEVLARTAMRLARQTSMQDQSRHLLVAFEFDRAEPGAVNEDRIASIARRIGSGARVRIVGGADRIGERQHNAELAQRRADAVAAAMREHLAARGIGDVEIVTEAPGAERARFPNDTPEGRFLSRSVELIIEQRR